MYPESDFMKHRQRLSRSCPNYEQCRCDLYGWCGPLASGETLRPKITTESE